MADGELSVAIAVLRVIRGWTQDDLAKASGIPESTLSDYERGNELPELETVERLLAAMGSSIRSLQAIRQVVQIIRTGGELRLSVGSGDRG